METILVIGNGYDIAHGLKTRYSDFINYIKEVSQREEEKDTKSALYQKIVLNPFFIYFTHLNSEIVTWVDLEQEIKKTTNAVKEFFQRLENANHKNTFSENDFSSILEYQFISNCQYISHGVGKKGVYYVRDKYYDPIRGIDWNIILDNLRHYFDEFKSVLSDYMTDIIAKSSEETSLLKIPQIEKLKVDGIVSFNYTSTYTRYGFTSKDVCHIHGKLEENNLVLGYEDDNPEDLRNVYFKKYFQRIQNRTDRLTDYLPEKITNAYFYGLSLDTTDKEAIMEIYNKSKYCNFFCYDQNDYERKIVNLISILDKERFLYDYYGNKIVFSPMEKLKYGVKV